MRRRPHTRQRGKSPGSLAGTFSRFTSFLIVPTCKGVGEPWAPTTSPVLKVVGAMNVLPRGKSEHHEDTEGFWACGFSDLMETSEKIKYPLEGDDS